MVPSSRTRRAAGIGGHYSVPMRRLIAILILAIAQVAMAGFGLLPNIEWVHDSGRHNTDIIPRVTFYYSF